MDDTTTFGNLSRSMERFSGEYEQAKVEKATSEMLIASAEYELAQLKEAFAAARLEPEPARSAPFTDAPLPVAVAPAASFRAAPAANDLKAEDTSHTDQPVPLRLAG